MADHYGDAKLLIGQFRRSSNKHMMTLTKWCPPENGDKSFKQAEKAIDRAFQRMGQSQIALLQYHIWDYSDDTFWHNLVHLQKLQSPGKISHLGLTNTDAAHLKLLLKSGVKIATNQVSCSVIDRRVVRGRLGNVCRENSAGVLAYGTLLDGYLTERNLSTFSFTLTEDDNALIAKAQEALTDVPGDCGDEYMRAPFLTATGDLSDHHAESKDVELRNAIAAGKRIEFSSGSKWEPIAGYCRAVRTGDTIRVSGTTANSPVPSSIPVLGGSSAGCQTVAVLDIIARALKALGGSMSDVVRTRIMVANEADCEAISRAHGWVFYRKGVRPANTLVRTGLIGEEFLVEIEAEAQVGYSGVLRI
ncbi:NADP-dependent oxidoreductase domain-containing protein [Aspergillus insuetus]